MANPAFNSASYAGAIKSARQSQLSGSELNKLYNSPTATASDLDEMYSRPSATPVETDRMSYEDTIVKTLMEHKDELVAVHREAKNITLEAQAGSSPIPMHPGARKYWEERGVKFK